MSIDEIIVAIDDMAQEKCSAALEEAACIIVDYELATKMLVDLQEKYEVRNNMRVKDGEYYCPACGCKVWQTDRHCRKCGKGLRSEVVIFGD